MRLRRVLVTSGLKFSDSSGQPGLERVAESVLVAKSSFHQLLVILGILALGCEGDRK